MQGLSHTTEVLTLPSTLPTHSRQCGSASVPCRCHMKSSHSVTMQKWLRRVTLKASSIYSKVVGMSGKADQEPQTWCSFLALPAPDKLSNSYQQGKWTLKGQGWGKEERLIVFCFDCLRSFFFHLSSLPPPILKISSLKSQEPLRYYFQTSCQNPILAPAIELY